jgi:arsenate reductase
MIKLYGITNCDTVKKARKWLDNNGIEYEFVDFRKTPLSTAQLKNWAAAIDWQTLLNKRSRTWRELPDSQKDPLNKTKALTLMQEIPTLIKRPVLEKDGEILVGFQDSEYQSLFQ